MSATGLFIGGIVAGFVVGTLGEYWVHRAMHWGWFLSGGHGAHHREGVGKGAVKEFLDYAIGSFGAAAVLVPLDYFFWSGGVIAAGFVAGLLLHAIVAAWCHQAQHEDPRLVWWLERTPVHFVHHELNQARYNFGISVDWWDRLFGTYRPEPNWRSLMDPNASGRPWWRLDWADRRALRIRERREKKLAASS